MSHPQFLSPLNRQFASRRLISPALMAPAILLFLFMTVGAPHSFAQAVFGSIIGTATDPTGAVIQPASVWGGGGGGVAAGRDDGAEFCCCR